MCVWMYGCVGEWVSGSVQPRPTCQKKHPNYFIQFCSSGTFAEDMNDFVDAQCGAWADADQRQDSHADLGRWQVSHKPWVF